MMTLHFRKLGAPDDEAIASAAANDWFFSMPRQLVSRGTVQAPSVTNLAKAAVAQMAYRPVTTNLVGWKSSMSPLWNGDYESYWLQRIDAYIRYAAAQPNMSTQWASLLSKPNYWALLRDWLRRTWATPASMVQWYKSRGVMVPVTPLPGVWYADTVWDPWIASDAGRKFFAFDVSTKF